MSKTLRVKLLCGLFLICTLSKAQDTAITYTQVKTIDSMSKQGIYEKVKLWAVSLFEKTQGVLQVDDKESGILAFDASTTALSPKAPVIDYKKEKDIYKLLPFYHDYFFKFKIQIREERYKVDITDIKLKNPAGTYTLSSTTTAPFKYSFSKQSKANEEWEDAKFTFSKFADGFLQSIYTAVSKKEDW